MIDKDVLIAQLLEQNQLLAEQVQLLENEVQQLRDKIARLEKNSSNSSKPPSSDIINPRINLKSKRKRKPGGQKGHRKFTREPFALGKIDSTLIHKLPDDEIRRRNLIVLDETEMSLQQIDLADKLYTIIEHRVRLYKTPDGRIIKAMLPKDMVALGLSF